MFTISGEDIIKEDIKIPKDEQFKYLGSVISKNASSKNDVLQTNLSVKRAIGILYPVFIFLVIVPKR